MLLRLVSDFLTARRAAGLSSQSLRTYGWHLARMVAWLQEHDVLELAQLDRALLRSWAAANRDHWGPATCRSAIMAARAWLRFMFEEGVITVELVSALRVPKVPQRVQRVVNIEEIGQMLAACDRSCARGVRDFALLNVLIDTGLRCSEVCRLLVQDVDLDHRVAVVQVKGGDQGFAYFGDSTVAAVVAWLAVRVAGPAVGELFVSVGGLTPGSRLTSRGLRIVVLRCGERAGIGGVCPHAFRRGMATIALQAGAPSRVVQVAGRWSDIRMVERYSLSLRGGGMYDRWSPADLANGKNGE